MAITFLVIVLCRTFSIGSPDYSRFLNIKGNVKLLVLGFAVVWSLAAFGEEIIGRGFLIDRLSLALQDSDYAPVVAVVVSSVVFGLVHFYQGVTGILDNTFTGLIFGAVYLKQNRILWATVLAHGLIDSIALVAFYFGVLP